MNRVVVWVRIVVHTPDGAPVVLRIGGGPVPDLALVDGLSCLQLVVRRGGGHMRLHDVVPALQELLGLAGLLGHVGGQGEVGEERQRLQEGVDRRDATP